KACVLPENPASYRVVRTKSYLFNKAEWMTKKLAAINQLREVLSYRQETIDSLKKLDQEITVLSQDVTLDIVQTN
ncbi:hypothetical protein P2P22_14465, partial [Escherichia coli]